MAQTDYEAEKSKLNSRNSSKTKWGAKLVKGREGSFASGIEFLTLASVISFSFPEATSSLREAGYFVGHLTDTISDILLGGSEGEKSIKNLKKSLDGQTPLKYNNPELGEAVARIMSLYQEREKLERAISRLKIQAKGTVKNSFEVGNNIKPQFVKNIDAAIVKLYGMNPDEALEKSNNINSEYLAGRQLYDSIRQMEMVLKNITDNKAQLCAAYPKECKVIIPQLDKVYTLLKEGYSIEDYLSELDSKGVGITKEEVSGLRQRVDTYRIDTEKTKTEVGYTKHIDDYSPNSAVTVITNPFVMAAAGVLLWKGCSRILPFGKEIDSVISKAASYPIRLAGDLANDLYDKICMSYAQRKQQSADGIK